jgi:hypothetical protein
LNPPAGYVLPFRTNRGKPPKRYSPDDEKRRSKYPIANYMSTKRLSEPLKGFVHVLPQFKSQLEFRKPCIIQNGHRQ